MLLIGTKLCKRRRRPPPPLRSTLVQFVMSLDSPPISATFTTGRLAVRCVRVHLRLELGKDEKKCPDEYTASQGDLLIGGSLSPSVVELRPNPYADWMRLYKFPVMAHVNSCWSGWGGWEAKGEESVQGLLPLSTLPGVILTKAETQADHVCCDR